jgi:hypothetical protein
VRRKAFRIAKRHLPVLEIPLVLVRFNHIASVTVNPNHGIMRTAVEFGVIDFIADRKGPRLFSPR